MQLGYGLLRRIHVKKIQNLTIVFCSLLRCSKSDEGAGVALIFSNRRAMLIESIDLTWEFRRNIPVRVPTSPLELMNTLESSICVKIITPLKSPGMTCKPLTTYLSSRVENANQVKEH